MAALILVQYSATSYLRLKRVDRWYAYTFQIYGMTPNEHLNLVNHLGHNMDKHRMHNRQTSGLIEWIDIAKMMLLEEFGLTAKYAGKRLSDIDITELVDEPTTPSDEPANDDPPEALQAVCNEESGILTTEEVDVDDSYITNLDADHALPKNRKVSVRKDQVWSTTETIKVEELFADFICTGQTPGFKAVSKAIQASLLLGVYCTKGHGKLSTKGLEYE